jgi:acyl dehydratase
MGTLEALHAPPVIGAAIGSVTVEVEKGRLRSFARSIGETRAVYLDEDAAQAAGFRSLPVPPTYLFCLEMLDSDAPLQWLTDLGVDLLHILHGEQRFEYTGTAVAGDTLTFTSRLGDVFEKKNGALRFYVKETQVTNQGGDDVATLKSTIVVRRA